MTRSVVVGTAGHIDHGKTALVRALTGTDCDRLPEERARGITIDLGFARLDAGAVELHFVDVPGHERLVHTMIAGAAGIDLALLVVAADEGIMPQTREHLEVIRLMGVRAGAVALTKVDLVDEDLAELAALEIRELLEGTAFDGAAVLPVSAHTGRGVDTLVECLTRLASELPGRRDDHRPFRLAVDRVFTLAGAGTVVTGTALWGQVQEGEEVQVLPGGPSSRVRRLHVHGEERTRVGAGHRVALNLAGVDTDEISRGQQLLGPGSWRPTRLVTVVAELLPRAPGALDEGAPLELHGHGARLQARVDRLLRRPLEPGARAVAQLRLAEPALLFPGDRVVFRRPAPVDTFGGGVVLDAHLRRVRRVEAPGLAERPGAGEGHRAELLDAWIRDAGVGGVAPSSLASRLGVFPEGIEPLLGRLLEETRIVAVRPDLLVSAASFATLRRAAAAELERAEEASAVFAGVPAADFVARLLPPRARSAGPAFLEALQRADVLEVAEGKVRPPGGGVRMTGSGAELVRRIDAAYREAGLEPPSPGTVAEALEARPAQVDGICRYLVDEGRLVRLEGRYLIHAEALEGVRQVVTGWPGDELEVGEFKARFGLTRKLAIPILGWLDDTRVTMRTPAGRKILRRE